jgi:hypothetical protein
MCRPLSAMVKTIRESPEEEFDDESVLDVLEFVAVEPVFCVQPPATNANVMTPSSMTMFHLECPRIENMMLPFVLNEPPLPLRYRELQAMSTANARVKRG